MQILKDLYFGNIQPSDREVKRGSEYQMLQREASAMEDAFRSERSAEGSKAYEAFHQKQAKLSEIEECDIFIKGYRLGVKLLLAVLLDYDSPLPQISEE